MGYYSTRGTHRIDRGPIFHIEIDRVDNLDKLYETIKEKGDTKINILVNENDKNYLFELKDKRKFDYETLKNLNKEQFIKKIRV